jgi:DNA-binding GntR family transcriptional regulator
VRIVNGAFEPEERLLEPLLTEELGVSRTPVREALRRLEQEGLVWRNPRDLGRYVRGLSPDEIREVLGVRAVLEGYAARLAAERATASELDVLASAHERAEQAVELGDIEQLVELNTQFHDGIVAASHAPQCAALIEALRDRILQYRLAFLLSDHLRRDSFREHRAILAALRKRDGDRAEVLLRRHVARIAEALVDEQRRPDEAADG